MATYSITNGAGQPVPLDDPDAVLHVDGTTGDDFLVGQTKIRNSINGHEGADWIWGGKQDDVLLGGKQDDVLWGDTGNDAMAGNSSNDVLYGSVGNDTMHGKDGNDFLSGGKGGDVMTGGKGDDILHGNSGDDLIVGHTGNDILYGTAGNDTLDGGAGDDTVSGGSGDDYVRASSGNDLMVGGSGFDTLDFSVLQGMVSVDMSKHTASFGQGANATTDFIMGFEKIVAGNGGIHVLGDKHDNTFVGGNGDDWFRGKGGSDTFTGGDGSDTFAFLKKDLAGGAHNVITDFTVGQDHLDLGDFLKGHSSYGQVVRIGEDAEGNAVVQGLVNKVWTDVATLQGVNAHDVGADHHAMTVHDLGLLA